MVVLAAGLVGSPGSSGKFMLVARPQDKYVRSAILFTRNDARAANPTPKRPAATARGHRDYSIPAASAETKTASS